MRSVLFLLLLFPGVLGAQIPRISIRLTPAVLDSFATRDPFSESYLPAVVESGGDRWEKAGIRYKGRSTRNFPKKPYRLKFPKDHLFDGKEYVNLNAMYIDKSFLREKLAWDFYASVGELAPSASYTTLAINDTARGLYLMVDRIDKRFLEARGRTVSSVYEAGGYYSLADMTVQGKELLAFYYPKEVGDKDEYDELENMLRTLNDAPDSLFEQTAENLFDMNSVYTWLAGNILMMVGDSYNKNYLLYRDTYRTLHQWIIIPWDYDQSFGISGDPAVPYPQSLLNEGFSASFPPLAGPSNILKDRIQRTPSMREHLRRRVDTLLSTVFTAQHLWPHIDSLAALIAQDAAADSMRSGSPEEFRDQVGALKYFITARRNYLLTTYVHPPSGSPGIVTLRTITPDTPLYCIGGDGWQFASLRFSRSEGLDSVRIIAHGSAVADGLDSTRCRVFVRRWLEIIPYPETAAFTASLDWMYYDLSSRETEIGGDHSGETSLRCYTRAGRGWRELPSDVNHVANLVHVGAITNRDCGPTSCFVLFAPLP